MLGQVSWAAAGQAALFDVFETAPNNAGAPGAWTQLYAESWNTAAVPLSSVLFELKGGTWRIEGSNPGSAVFDNFKAAKP